MRLAAQLFVVAVSHRLKAIGTTRHASVRSRTPVQCRSGDEAPTSSPTSWKLQRPDTPAANRATFKEFHCVPIRNGRNLRAFNRHPRSESNACRLGNVVGEYNVAVALPCALSRRIMRRRRSGLFAFSMASGSRMRSTERRTHGSTQTQDQYRPEYPRSRRSNSILPICFVSTWRMRKISRRNNRQHEPGDHRLSQRQSP